MGLLGGLRTNYEADEPVRLIRMIRQRTADGGVISEQAIDGFEVTMRKLLTPIDTRAATLNADMDREVDKLTKRYIARGHRPVVRSNFRSHEEATKSEGNIIRIGDTDIQEVPFYFAAVKSVRDVLSSQGVQFAGRVYIDTDAAWLDDRTCPLFGTEESSYKPWQCTYEASQQGLATFLSLCHEGVRLKACWNAGYEAIDEYVKTI